MSGRTTRPSPPRSPSPPRTPGEGWRRLRRILAPRRNRSQAVVFALCVLLGLTAAVQLQREDAELEGIGQQSLVRLLQESDRAVSDLEDENHQLEEELRGLRSDRADREDAQRTAERRAAELQVLSGAAPATGPGLQMTISDPDGGLRAATLLGLIQELRNAGAEAIQIGQVRVVASTWVSQDGDGLVIDGTRVSAPLTVLAIGDPEVMQPALMIPGGAADRITSDGATLDVHTPSAVTIEAIAPPREWEYAQVVK